jgi:hypothetical protein
MAKSSVPRCFGMSSLANLHYSAVPWNPISQIMRTDIRGRANRIYFESPGMIE